MNLRLCSSVETTLPSICGMMGVHGFGDALPSESMMGTVDTITIEGIDGGPLLPTDNDG